MDNPKARKRPEKPERPDDEHDELQIDPNVHRRLLRHLNDARTADELVLAPRDRMPVYERAEHPEHEELHPRPEPLMERDLADEILRARNRSSPLYGFFHIRDLLAILPRVRDLLDRWLWSFGPGVHGRWDTLYTLQVGGNIFEMEHAALLHTYEVLFLADSTDTLLWDPSDEVNPQFTLLGAGATGLAANLVCGGHSFLSDGKLLTVGGGGLGPGAATSIQAWKFAPDARTWTKTTGNMSTDRWYPTVLTLGDESGPTGLSGRVLVASGKLGTTTPPTIDIYSEATDSFSSMTISGTGKTFRQTYPGLHMLPNGEIFYAPTGFGSCNTASVYSLSERASYLTFTPLGGTAGNWTDVDVAMNRTKGMSALILQATNPFVRVFVAGGGDIPTSKTVQMITLSGPSPTWAAPDAFPDGRSRVNANIVFLPDGTVLICGGLEATPYTSYTYDPANTLSPWSEMDELNTPRHYHSAALLLPSGKVMIAGGAANGGCTVSQQNTIEVFSPPYLFNVDGTPAARPSITSIDGVAPTAANAPTVHHGATFTIETPEAGDIASVVLVRPMAVTHQTDTEQRVIHCPHSFAGGNSITATSPNGIHPHALAPRGYYMLFLLTTNGVPSEGKFMHLH